MVRLNLEEIARKNSLNRIFTDLNVRKIRTALRQLFITDLDHTLEWSILELIHNGIKHGNKNNTKKHVTTYFLRYQRNLYVAVQDEGKGFDVKTAIERERVLKRVGRGYGLCTTQTLLTAVYNFGDNVVYLRKYLGRNR